MLSQSQSSEHNKQADIRLSRIQKQIKKKKQFSKEIVAVLMEQQKIPIKFKQLALDTVYSQQINSLNQIDSIKNPTFQPQTDYFQLVWKTFVKNQILIKQVKGVSQKNKLLKTVIEQIQRLSDQYVQMYRLKNRKKFRRTATEIEKNFTCPYENCDKVYGSDVSLNLHIKLKHNGGNKTDREKLAQEICQAQERGQRKPEMYLNLPPGFLNQYRKLYFQRDLGNSDSIQFQQQDPFKHYHRQK